MSSKIKYVIGTGALLDFTLDAWREVEPDTDLRPLHLTQDVAYKFDLSILDQPIADNVTAFAIFDAQFLNFRRYELMGELKARGFKMPPLISKSAVIDSTASIAENVMVGAAAIIGHRSQIGFNTVIGAASQIGHACKIGHSVYLAPGVMVGAAAKIAANVTLGLGVIVADGIEVGKFSVIDKPGKLVHHIPSKTFIHDAFDEAIVIVDGLNT